MFLSQWYALVHHAGIGWYDRQVVVAAVGSLLYWLPLQLQNAALRQALLDKEH
jgi:hypothetical protein